MFVSKFSCLDQRLCLSTDICSGAVQVPQLNGDSFIQQGEKGKKKGKNGGVGSCCALADGGKGINRSCLLSLARRVSLGRKDGMGREGQAGRLADGQSGGGERVAVAKAAGGAVSGTGWSSRFAQEVCGVCPLPVFPCLNDISCLGCQQLRDFTCPPEAALCLTGGQRSCNGKAEALAERRGRKSSGHWEKNCWHTSPNSDLNHP